MVTERLSSSITCSSMPSFLEIHVCILVKYFSAETLPDILQFFRPVWARERCRISPPRFLAKCRKRRLNQGSFVKLYFALFAFSGLCLVFVVSVLDLSSGLYFPA